jgi:hypothetical protein
LVNRTPELQIGTTVLACHVHPGKETCLECEPGVVQTDQPSSTISAEPIISKEKLRRKEMKEIKNKYGLKREEGGERLSLQYQDRAGQRRIKSGSDNPYEKTEVADVRKAIRSTNKGFKMLSKMGWSEGEGLGKEEQGRVEPVTADQRAERVGLGMAGQTAVRADPKMKQKADIWRKTQKRFDNIPKDD